MPGQSGVKRFALPAEGLQIWPAFASKTTITRAERASSMTKVVQEQVTYNATLALETGPLKSLVKKINGS